MYLYEWFVYMYEESNQMYRLYCIKYILHLNN